jgi:N-acetylmuramoyl-L-alanine amidase
VRSTRAVAAAVAGLSVAGLSVAGCGAGGASGPVAGRAVTSRPAALSAPRADTAGRLHGEVVGIDPGHNGHNHDDVAYLDRQVWNGREYEDCNTTGTETDAGYTEARFTFRVATFLRRDLQDAGAKVVMTRHSNTGIGPCVNKRAEIINHAHADVGIDIHGDGGPASGRGFAVLEPVRDKENKRVVMSSATFGHDVRHALLAGTSMPTSTYDGTDGVTHRDDLAGLNLTRVPLVLVECGNMRNATDARLMTSTRFQRSVAAAFTAAIERFLGR